MIDFEQNGKRFSMRAAGVALDGDRVLISKGEADSLWALPGGRVEFNETAEKALVREMREEIDADVSVSRLLWVVENMFELQEVSLHGIELYFLMTIPREPRIHDNEEFFGNDDFLMDGSIGRLVFRWHPIESLQDAPLVPPFLVDALRDIPDTPQHVVSLR